MTVIGQALDYEAQKEHTTRDPVPCYITGGVGRRTLAILYDDNSGVDEKDKLGIPQNEYQQLMSIPTGDMEAIQAKIEEILHNHLSRKGMR